MKANYKLITKASNHQDDSQQHVDDTYVNSAQQEEMVAEASEYEQEDEIDYYDDNMED